MGLESAPTNTINLSDINTKPLSGQMINRIWLIVSVPLEPFHIVMRLSVLGYHDSGLRCSLSTSPTEKNAMHELAAFYLAHKFPTHPPRHQWKSINSQKPGIQMTLIDDVWPDTAAATLNAYACHFDHGKEEPTLDFFFAPKVDIDAMIRQIERHGSEFDGESTHHPSFRAS